MPYRRKAVDEGRFFCLTCDDPGEEGQQRMFTRNQQGKPQRSGTAGGFSFIGPDVVVTGNIAAPGDLHVDGRIEGDIRCASLTQGATGQIHGNVAADKARLAGLVDGAIVAGELVVEGSARITGDVAYQSLNIEVGGQVDGRLSHRDGTAAAQPRLIAAAE